MSFTLDSFIATQNVDLYKRQLTTEAHPDKRRILLQLLANEIAKLPEPVKRAEMIKTASLR